MAAMRTPKILIAGLMFGVSLVSFSLLSAAQTSNPKLKTAQPSAEELLAKHELDKAEELLKSQIVANPNDSHAITLFGRLREEQHLYRKAEALYREALRANPISAEARESLSKLYLAEGRFLDGISVAEPWTKSYPDQAEAKIMLGALYERARRFDDSLKACESLVATPQSRKVLAVVITDRMMLGQMDTAQPLIVELMRNSANDPKLVPELARALLRNGLTRDAAEMLSVVSLKLQPTASLLAVMAEAAGRQGRLDEAQQLADRALTLDEKSVDALAVSAQIAARKSDWKDAAEFFKYALENGPPNISLLQGLTYSNMQRDDIDAAHASAELLYQLQPESSDAALSLALVDVRGKHWGEADALLDKVLAVRPNDKAAHLARGMAKYNLGELDVAVAHLNASLGQGKADGEAYYHLGLVAKQRGDLSAAAAQMESAITANPEKFEVYSSLGQLYAQIGKLEQARALLEKAVTILPEDTQSHYQLASVYRRLSMPDKAREEMEIYQRQTKAAGKSEVKK
jgi:tetratricopeptide (TPR) repeat protein